MSTSDRTDNQRAVLWIGDHTEYKDPSMREAMVVNDRPVVAGPDSPEVATCPACGGIVEKRRWRRMGGQTTYFYRHKAGMEEKCPLRYRPCS